MNAQPLLSKSLRTSENRTSLAKPRLYPWLSCLQKAESFTDAVETNNTVWGCFVILVIVI